MSRAGDTKTLTPGNQKLLDLFGQASVAISEPSATGEIAREMRSTVEEIEREFGHLLADPITRFGVYQVVGTRRLARLFREFQYSLLVNAKAKEKNEK